MRFLIVLLALSGSVAAQERFVDGQMGAYVNLCSGGKTGALCQMYLAGYRAALYDFRAQAQEVNDYAQKKCSNVEGCSVDETTVAMQMFEGCNEAAKTLPANVVHQILINYTQSHPESLNEPFPVVYQAAVGDAFPCK